MIFLTVGTQLGFPRLVEAMDAWAATTSEEVIAQVGSGRVNCANLAPRGMLPPAEFADIFSRARVVVAHAGIGTILAAKRYRRPLIIVPRMAGLGEHRNDHQAATARTLEKGTAVRVCWEVAELPALLEETAPEALPEGPGASHAALIEGLKGFIAAAPLRR